MLELLIKPKSGLGRLGMKSITILPVAYLGYVSSLIPLHSSARRETARSRIVLTYRMRTADK